MLADLRRADLVHAVRGCDGGYRLARDPGLMRDVLDEVNLVQVASGRLPTR